MFQCLDVFGERIVHERKGIDICLSESLRENGAKPQDSRPETLGVGRQGVRAGGRRAGQPFDRQQC